MKQKLVKPQLGAMVRASGYMVRHSTMRQWLEADSSRAIRGFKTWKRKLEPFSGVFVGVRRLTIKRWWLNNNRGELDLGSELTPIIFWLVAYSPRANARYVLPGDVEIVEAAP